MSNSMIIQIVINIVFLCLIGAVFFATVYNRQLQLKDDILFSQSGMLVKICVDANDTYEDFKSCVNRGSKVLK